MGDADLLPPLEARSGLEPWGRGELPAPPSTEGLRLLRVVGPGAIVLGASIGSGEWLIGPSALVKYGMALLWVTTAAVFFQTVFNTELVRYTLYTGESAFTGFMRTKPHSTFWAWTYSALYFLQSGWPGWAGASAAAVFFLVAGRAAGPEERHTLYRTGLLVYSVCLCLLLFGGRRIERMLELLNWIMVIAILGSLLVLCLVFATPGQFLGMGLGFFGFDL
ncbi:MAG TPA: Nramp family divalent metal transporter, partial [Vicinamibacteria bacterium]